MKIAFTTSGDSLDSQLDSRFGRAKAFLVYDSDDGSFKIHDNEQNLNAAQGAGIQAAQAVARLGAGVLVTGHCGPKAFSVLNSAGVKIFSAGEMTIRQALEKYSNGEIKEISSPDVEGHWV